MFQIQNLKVSVENKEIIHGVSLQIAPGEIHAVMGPNGSGKSTLANTIMGHPKYIVTEGEILMRAHSASGICGSAENLVALKPHKRAQAGVFLAFQYPREIPGVPVTSFLQMAVNAVREARGQTKLNPMEFRKLLRAKLAEFALDSKFLNRSMNEGFSGGEKKKMEILQMALLEPRLCVLDETDSGLDVDALKIVAEGVNRFMGSTRLGLVGSQTSAAKGRGRESSTSSEALSVEASVSGGKNAKRFYGFPQKDRSILIITHYQRILHYVQPHFVHVMMDGKIVASGGPELGEKIEEAGYEWIKI